MFPAEKTKPGKRKTMFFSKLEAMHLTVSVITISLAFSTAFAYSGLNKFLAYFPIALITVGIGFIFHESAHKYTAMKKGCITSYRAWWPGLLFAVGLAVLTRGNFIFAAPGAVYISGRYLSIKDDGEISLSGPLTNLGLGVLFLLLAAVTVKGSFLNELGNVGAWVNFFLAFFNLIPFPPLDGNKVIQWSVPIWGLAIGVALILTFL